MNRPTPEQDTDSPSGHRRVGLLGGTFDPIHYGHLIAAQSVAEELALDQVLFIPCGIPPHKDVDAVAPAADRYLLTEGATADNPLFTVSRVELDRPGPSYTVDTLRLLADKHPDDRWFVIVGLDAFADVADWHQSEQLFQLAEFTVVSRPGYNGTLLQRILAALAPWQRERVRSLRIPSLDISSTEIRRRVRSGRSIRYLVPGAVHRLIIERELYGHRRQEADRPKNRPN